MATGARTCCSCTEGSSEFTVSDAVSDAVRIWIGLALCPTTAFYRSSYGTTDFFDYED